MSQEIYVGTTLSADEHNAMFWQKYPKRFEKCTGAILRKPYTHCVLIQGLFLHASSLRCKCLQRYLKKVQNINDFTEIKKKQLYLEVDMVSFFLYIRWYLYSYSGSYIDV